MIRLLILVLIAQFFAAAVSACSVTDGDTIRCGDERIRLQGIDAPEMDERGGKAAKSAAEALVYRADSIDIIRTGTDRYGRTTGYVTLDGKFDLGAALIISGVVNRCGRYDRQGKYIALPANSDLPRKGYCQ